MTPSPSAIAVVYRLILLIFYIPLMQAELLEFPNLIAKAYDRSLNLVVPEDVPAYPLKTLEFIDAPIYLFNFQ